MINYRTENEKLFLMHYAKSLGCEDILSILENGAVSSSEEAINLSKFFWAAVDESIKDNQQGVTLPWNESSELLSERVMRVISGHLERMGFEQEWESVSDAQDQQGQ